MTAWRTTQIAPVPEGLTASLHFVSCDDIGTMPVVAMLLQESIIDQDTRVVAGVMDPDTGLVCAVDQMPDTDSVIYINGTIVVEQP